MKNVLYVIFVVILSFGAASASEVTSYDVSDMAMTMSQADMAENVSLCCGDCEIDGVSDATACESECPLPCTSSGVAGIATSAPSSWHAVPIGSVAAPTEPPMLHGANPSLEPFPPKRTV